MKDTFQKIVEQRYACREFSDDSISKEQLDYILEAGRLSPSSLGLEPWRFYIATSKEKKQEICKIAKNQSHVGACGAIIILVARLDFGEYFVEKLQKRNMSQEELDKRIQIYKPFIDSMDIHQKYAYAREQTFLALGNLANATKAIGLDSCIIGGFDNDLLDSYLGLDTSKEKSSVMLVIGKARANREIKKIRFSKEEIIRNLD